ncbi:MAG TPA: EAL domain-containing protein, partial [Longimicrobiaceae bacterium]|nr:EAL domain-containing protein [Longimicrobiaceae bacterium]
MLGHPEKERTVAPAVWLRHVHPADRGRLRGALRDHVEGRTPHVESEHRMRHRDGGWRWVLVRGLAVRDAGGVAVRMAGSQSDVTARKEAEERLVHNALHDAMTSLPNRLLFLERLRAGIARCRARGGRFAVLFVDLDGFKVVNDSLGHLAGDELLAAVGRRLSRCVPACDTVARLGGDEFAVLLAQVADVDDAVGVSRRIQAELAAPFFVAGSEVFTGASIGIALGGAATAAAEDVLREADTAMYRAKAAGRAGYRVFDAAMHERALSRLQMETDLRRGLERGQVQPYYQPVVRLADGRLTGFEALARWHHPVRGLLLPGEFVSMAEDTGLVVPLGLEILRAACRQTVEWTRLHPHAAPLMVSVNLSARQMAAPGFAASVAGVLASTGLDPRCLTLEITESMLAGNPEAAEATLAELKALGVRLAVDDFGTGYSSLSYLHRFPIDELKIDRSFVSRMDGPSGGAEIVRTVLALARNLGLSAVAEGVETARQREMLHGLGCNAAQGYLFSPPVPAAEAEAMLASRTPGPASDGMSMSDGMDGMAETAE